MNTGFFATVHLLMILVSFLADAVISGYLLRNGALNLGHNYSGLLYLQAASDFNASAVPASICLLLALSYSTYRARVSR